MKSIIWVFRNNIFISCFLLSSFTPSHSFGQSGWYEPEYIYLKSQLDSGNVNIDYRKLRFYYCMGHECSFCSIEYKKFQKRMIFNYGIQNYPKAAKYAHQILEMNYTEMFAHEILWKYYKSIGDTSKFKKHKSIQEGLLNSIIQNGDGKTCDSAWEIGQESDADFVLRHLKMRKIEKPIRFPGNFSQICSEVKAKNKFSNHSFHFNVKLWIKKLETCGLRQRNHKL